MTKKYNYKNHIIIETCDDVIVDHSETAKCYCTIILGNTDETYDVVASYMGEYDETVISEILEIHGYIDETNEAVTSEILDRKGILL